VGDPAPARRPLAVFDIDGVVADVRHRLHHVESKPKNWDAFFAGAAEDPPIPAGLALVAEYAADHDIVWLTGRPQRLRRVTIAWLRHHGLRAAVLHMRPGRDFRPAPRFKSEVVADIARRADVAVVVDDDPAVVAALRAEGFPARLVEFIPREPVLAEAQDREGRT
jgi:phosphoglycolate phosphatase-like HAD superfamily hydrolase